MEYKTQTIWVIHSLTNPGYPEDGVCLDPFLCRGVAADTIYNWGYSFREGVTIQKETLYYTGEKVPFRIFHVSNEKCTKWFGSEEAGEASRWAVKEAQKDKLDGGYEHDGEILYHVDLYTLNTKNYEPMEFPRRVELTMSSKIRDGRLVVRLNAHPEYDGHRSHGKYYFPDKSFNACVGPAMVSISKETETYGFLTGEMIKPENVPDFDQLLDWAWLYRPDGRVAIIDSPFRGTYYASEVENESGRQYSRFYVNDQLDKHQCDIGDYIKEADWGEDYVLYDVQNYAVIKSFTDLFLESAWGDKWTWDDIHAIFNNCEGDETLKARFQWEMTDKIPIGNQLERAVAVGLVKPWELPGYKVYTLKFCTRNILSAINFTPEEAKELAAEIRVVNEHADEDIKALVKRGKLKIE